MSIRKEDKTIKLILRKKVFVCVGGDEFTYLRMWTDGGFL
jgi:hypothetical protein